MVSWSNGFCRIRLPGCLKNPSSLEYLETYGAKETLKEWCRKDKGADWPNISHIQFIEINILGGGGNSVQVKILGDGVMFVGLNRSVAMLAEECAGFRRNCIYFLYDGPSCEGEIYLGGGGGDDAGVFDLSDWSIQPLPYWAGDYGHRPAIWFFPTLC